MCLGVHTMVENILVLNLKYPQNREKYRNVRAFAYGFKTNDVMKTDVIGVAPSFARRDLFSRVKYI